jgi:hypothetical protein
MNYILSIPIISIITLTRDQFQSIEMFKSIFSLLAVIYPFIISHSSNPLDNTNIDDLGIIKSKESLLQDIFERVMDKLKMAENKRNIPNLNKSSLPHDIYISNALIIKDGINSTR